MSKSVRLCVSVCLTVYSCVCSVSKSVRLCVFCVQECKVVCACARVCVCVKLNRRAMSAPHGLLEKYT